MRTPLGAERQLRKDRRSDADAIALRVFGLGTLKHTSFSIEVQSGNTGIEDEASHRNTISMPRSPLSMPYWFTLLSQASKSAATLSGMSSGSKVCMAT